MKQSGANEWAKGIWPKIEAKISCECDRWGDKVPYIARDGHYTDMFAEKPAWWTNGFWPGILWLLYHQTKDEKYLNAARGVEEKFDSLFDSFDGLHHDVGFMWMNSAVMDYQLTKNARSKTRAMHAATILAGRYNPRGKFIRAWNDDKTGWMIIDCLMNLALLYWASENSGDPRFRYIACSHTDTAERYLLREDGSCNHIAILDLERGYVVDTPAGQGYASGSSWTRGQSWAVYGFAIGAAHAKGHESAYEDTNRAAHCVTASKRAANYVISQLALHDWVPPIDYRAPVEPSASQQIKDTSAGAITAAGLLQLADLLEESESTFYRNAALKILQAMEASYCDWEPSRDSIVQEGATAYHVPPSEYHVPLIYADYFFIEAVHRLLHPDFRVW